MDTSGSLERRQGGNADEGSEDEVVLRRQQRTAPTANLSDNISSDNIILEAINSERPFAGLVRGSSVPMDWAENITQRAGGAVGSHRQMAPTYSPPLSLQGTSAVGERLSNPLQSSNDEEWAQIEKDLTQIKTDLPFSDYLDKKFGLSLCSPRQGLGILDDVTREKAKTEAEQANAAATNGRAGDDVVMQCGSLQEWLHNLQLPQYERAFNDNGYDNVQFLNGVLNEQDISEMGIKEENHVAALKSGLEDLPASLPPSNTLYKVPKTIREWLDSIDLVEYEENFTKNGFGCMERVRKIWDVELSMVLEVRKLGHRKRILVSLGDRPLEPHLLATLDPKDLSIELSKLNEDIHELKEQLFAELPPVVSRECRPPDSTNATIRRSGKKKRAPLPPGLVSTRPHPTVDLDSSPPSSDSPSLPVNHESNSLTLRDPSHLLQTVVGSVRPSQTSWKHEPRDFIHSHIEFTVTYLGSTLIKEVRGPETTMQSIREVRKCAEAAERELTFGEAAKPSPPPLVVLAISSAGVRYSTPHDQVLVCGHEIRNIHGVCQDADDLSHFAYITIDKSDASHWCHVFRVQTRDEATDIVLALGEAFEVAFQLRGERSGPVRLPSHSRTRSDCSPSAPQPGTPNCHKAPRSHSRSHSSAARQVASSSAHDLLAEEEEEGDSPSHPDGEPRRASEGCLLDAPTTSQPPVRRDSDASALKTKAPKPPPPVASRRTPASSSSSSHFHKSQHRPNHHERNT